MEWSDALPIILGFVLGLIPSFLGKVSRFIYKKVKLHKLVNLYYEHYILHTYLLLSNLENESYLTPETEARNFCANAISSLGFELKHELTHSHSNYSFELTKLVVFTQAKLIDIEEQLAWYRFKSLAYNPDEYKYDYEKKLEAVKRIQENFKDEAHDHIKLKSLEFKNKEK